MFIKEQQPLLWFPGAFRARSRKRISKHVCTTVCTWEGAPRKRLRPPRPCCFSLACAASVPSGAHLPSSDIKTSFPVIRILGWFESVTDFREPYIFGLISSVGKERSVTLLDEVSGLSKGCALGDRPPSFWFHGQWVGSSLLSSCPEPCVSSCSVYLASLSV